MEKTFTFAGTSNLNGVVAYRFANGADRAKVLAKNGHTDIDLRACPKPMTKAEATQWLNEQDVFAEANKVTAKSTASKPRAQKPVAASTSAVDDDGFVEPKDEKIQVAMARKAREYPGLSARQLYEMVTMTVKEFGDTEPNF